MTPARLMAAAVMTAGLAACASMAPKPLPTASEALPADPPTRLSSSAHPALAAGEVLLDKPLREADLVRIALTLSPQLKAQRAQIGVGEAQLLVQGLVPDPQLSVSSDRPDAPGLVDALAAGLNFDLASLLTLGPRREAAQAALGQVHHDLAWAEWLHIQQVRTLARRIAWQTRQREVAAQAAQAARSVLDRAEASLAEGDTRIDDVSLYRVAYLDARDRALGFERATTAAQLELRSLLGLAPRSLLRLDIPVTLMAEQPRPAVATLTERAFELREDLRALREAYAAQEANLVVATRNALPLPQLSLNRARDSGGIWSHGLGLGFALPLWNFNRGEIALARASREQLAAEFVSRLHQTRADLAAIDAELVGLLEARSELAEQVAQLETAQLKLSRASQDGSIAVVTYEAVRAALLDKTLTLLAIEQAIDEGNLALETASGALFSEIP